MAKKAKTKNERKVSSRIATDGEHAGWPVLPLSASGQGRKKDDAEAFIVRNARRYGELLDDPEILRLVELAQKVPRNENAIKTILRRNQRLVLSWAYKYRGHGVDIADLVQEGNIGFIRAIELFKKHKGAKLQTYASLWIKQAMMRAIAYQSIDVVCRLPVHLIGEILKVQKEWKKAMLSEKEALTPEYLSKKTGVKLEKVKRIRGYLYCFRHDSLDRKYKVSDGDTVGDRLSGGFTSPDGTAEGAIDIGHLTEWLTALPVKDREFIERRFGLNHDREEKTPAWLAEFYRLSEEKIIEWEERILGVLRILGDRDKLNAYEE
jgi:RNA polymerase primary sigma factor